MANKHVWLYCVSFFVGRIIAHSIKIELKIRVGDSLTNEGRYGHRDKIPEDIAIDKYDDYKFNEVNFDDAEKSHDQLYKIRRPKRETSDYAGYSNNPNMCQTYNNNLLKLWDTLDKHVLTKKSETPSKLALHNIALIIQAYLDHQDEEKVNDTIEHLPMNAAINESHVSAALDDVINIITSRTVKNKNAKIYEAVVRMISTEVAENNECIDKAREKVAKQISKAFMDYLVKSDCRRTETSKKFAEYTNLAGVKLNSTINVDQAKAFLRYYNSQDKNDNCEENHTNDFIETMRNVMYGHIKDMQCDYLS